MNKSQIRVPPGILLIFSLVLLALVCWLVVGGVPTEKDKAKAKVLETIVEERSMGDLLEAKASEVNGLTNVPNQFLLNPFLTNDEYKHISWTSHTNGVGNLVDSWETPFQIEFLGQTNFIIISAGPNAIFGDTDDIVFNSASNDFVKP